MFEHFNIATGESINPFKGVRWIRIAAGALGYQVQERLIPLLNTAEHVDTRKLDSGWVLLYPIQLLNFVSLVNWYEPFRGRFTMPTKYRGGNGVCYIHFCIEDDILVCW